MKPATSGQEGISTRLRATILSITMAVVAATYPAQAQTFRVLHTFTGGPDGGSPTVGLTMDRAGNLYGTAEFGGTGTCRSGSLVGCGTVFRLSHAGTGWIFTPLYSFTGWAFGDGAYPEGRVSVAADGSLYGTTTLGGNEQDCLSGPGCGTVFRLQPQSQPCKGFLCPWQETVLYRFTGSPDGFRPSGDLTFDPSGNIYGTTYNGGADYGTVYELTRYGGSYGESILYNFTSGDGAYPSSGVTLDNAGNLYGTATDGGPYDAGTVFELKPSGSGWTPSTVYAFTGGLDGYDPFAGLVFDQAGNLYGATPNGRPEGEAVLYQLVPGSGSWSFHEMYSIQGQYGGGPRSTLLLAPDGNFYGTTIGLGVSWGSVFKLTHTNGSWVYTDLYDFTGGADGGYPYGGVVMDEAGNLYGTASAGAESGCNYGCGVVFEITP